MTDEELLEQVVAAWRPRDIDGAPGSHPAWHDLSAETRAIAFEEAVKQRKMEAALDPDGLSATARIVLAQITAGLSAGPSEA